MNELQLLKGAIWYLEMDLSDLDAPFQGCYRVCINTRHPLCRRLEAAIERREDDPYADAALSAFGWDVARAMLIQALDSEELLERWDDEFDGASAGGHLIGLARMCFPEDDGQTMRKRRDEDRSRFRAWRSGLRRPAAPMTTYPGEGNFCYPRLDSQTAAERYADLLGRLPAGHRRVTTAVVKQLRDRVTRPEVGVTASDDRQELVPVPAAHLNSLARKVRKLAKSEGFPYVAHRVSTNFDTSGDLLVTDMNILPWDATSVMVWANLALVLPDVAAWRYPDLHEDHFATRIDRHVFGRLWWRSYILDGANSRGTRDGTPLGEDELVAIFERPVSIGRMPAVAREMVRQIRASQELAAPPAPRSCASSPSGWQCEVSSRARLARRGRA